MSNKPLTAKQQAFVNEYLIDLNATAAAKRAGYSDTTANGKAHAWVGKSREKSKAPHVWDAVQEAIQKRAERTQIDADWLLKRLAEEVEADIADIYDDKGNLKPVKEWPKIWRQGLVSGIDTQELKGRGKTKITNIRTSDRNKIKEMIGRHVSVQAFKDQVGQTATVTQVNMTTEEYKQARAEMLQDDDC